MSEDRVETVFYDKDGNETEDASRAVRGEIVVLDPEGNVLSRRPDDSLDWKVDPISLKGDEGELATRPRDED
jgi:hypothetical protein